MVHLLHHVNLKVPAAVHLAHIARKDISNAHMSIVSDIHLDSVLVQKFFLGGAFGQHSWPSRLNIAGSGNLHISIGSIICPDWARSLRIL